MKTIVVVLFCYGHVVPQETDPVPPDNVEAIGSYIFRYGYGVMGSKLERKTSTSILHCNHFCLKNSKCVSFNYQLTGNSHGSCELSEQGVVSREESDGVLEDIPGCIFVQTVRQDLVRYFYFNIHFALDFFSAETISNVGLGRYFSH